MKNLAPKHWFVGRCIDPLCKLLNRVYMATWEFKLVDIFECQRCGNDIPASEFDRE